MAYGECNFSNPECTYYFREPKPGGNALDGCYSDVDHILEKSQARTGLERQFLHHPLNKRQICRLEHDEWTVTHPEPRKLDPELMRGVLDGVVQITQDDLVRRIYGVL